MVNNCAKITMAKIVENIIAQPEEGYEGRYGTVIVVVRDTETGRVATASVQWNTIKSKGEATAEATKDAMDKL